MKIKIRKEVKTVIQEVFEQYLTGSLTRESDISSLEKDLQESWQSQLTDESRHDATVLRDVFARSSSAYIELSDEEAESCLRSLTNIRLHLVDTVLGDSDVENLESAIPDAIQTGNRQLFDAIQHYYMLGSLESALLANLMGDDYEFELPIE